MSTLLPTASYRRLDRGEKQLAAQIDLMVSRRIQSDEVMIMNGRWHEKFRHYAGKAADFLEGLGHGHILPEYEPEDIARVRDIMKKHRIEGSMYQQTAQERRDVEAVTITKTIKRITDLQKYLDEQQRKHDEREE